MIVSFKNRTIIKDKPILIYRNLHKKGKVYSIRQNSLVVGHTTNISLKNVKFIINMGGKKKAIESGIRNVHAFVSGIISNEKHTTELKVKYNPFIDKGFYYDENNEISEALFININETGLHIKI